MNERKLIYFKAKKHSPGNVSHFFSIFQMKAYLQNAVEALGMNFDKLF